MLLLLKLHFKKIQKSLWKLRAQISKIHFQQYDCFTKILKASRKNVLSAAPPFRRLSSATGLRIDYSSWNEQWFWIPCKILSALMNLFIKQCSCQKSWRKSLGLPETPWNRGRTRVDIKLMVCCRVNNSKIVCPYFISKTTAGCNNYKSMLCFYAMP